MEKIKLSTILAIIKAVTAVVIVVLLLVPTRLHRRKYHDVLVVDKSDTFSSPVVQPKHHFCYQPEAMAVPISEGQHLVALGLPREAEISAENSLLKLGQCLAKSRNSSNDPEVCLCGRRWPVVFMIVFGVICVIFNFAAAYCSPKPDTGCLICKLLEGFLWLSLATAATTINLLDVGYFKYPQNDTKSRAYFDIPYQLASACVLAYLYAIFSAADCYIFFKLKSNEQPEKIAPPPSDRYYEESIEEFMESSEFNSKEQEALMKLMEIRRVVEPRYKVLTLSCKTWP